MLLSPKISPFSTGESSQRNFKKLVSNNGFNEDIPKHLKGYIAKELKWCLFFYELRDSGDDNNDTSVWDWTQKKLRRAGGYFFFHDKKC